MIWMILFAVLVAGLYAYRISGTIQVKTPSCSSCESKKTFNEQS